MDTPHVFTGNYGELRPNHFHMGLDFSTNGKINFPVYAVADGYVSRIKVSSVGYGRALYITHHNGKLSLYAHLTAYAGAVAEAVKREQDAKQNYEVEFFPAKNDLKIKKGELIGYSGNSGNSTGPHLHFEIRDAKTEVPLNPLEIYKIQDTVKPRITHIGFYDLSDTLNPVLKHTYRTERARLGAGFLKNDSLTLNQAILGFAFSGYDQFVHRGNVNVPFAAKVYLDKQLIYAHAFHNLAFSDQRYVNEFSENHQKVKYQKCFLPTVFPPAMYSQYRQKGRIVLTDTNYHALHFELSDEQGNVRSLDLCIRTKTLNGYVTAIPTGTYVECTKDVQLINNGLRLFIPKTTLYHSAYLSVHNKLEANGTFTILPIETHLASTFFIHLRVPSRLLKHKDKLVLTNAGRYIPTLSGDSAAFAVYNFGEFFLNADTVAPRIKTQLSAGKIKRLKKIESFSFVLSDAYSGIGRYSLFLNGQWVLAEYDAKNNLLTYILDGTTPAGNLSFRVEAEDRVGNKTTFNYLLKRPATGK